MFNVGDRVRFDYGRKAEGTLVVWLAGHAMWAVEADPDFDGHSCDGRITGHRGWYVPEDRMQLSTGIVLNKEEVEVTTTEEKVTSVTMTLDVPEFIYLLNRAAAGGHHYPLYKRMSAAAREAGIDRSTQPSD